MIFQIEISHYLVTSNPTIVTKTSIHNQENSISSKMWTLPKPSGDKNEVNQ